MASEKFGRYAILEEIGRGGMATVYRAYDPRFEREVAIKVLPPQLLHDPTFQTRFTREAKIIAALEHAAIVPVYDFGEENGQPFYVMRLMSGGSLADLLEKGPLSPADAARILSRVAEALDEAHRLGFVHRDLKPGNILFDARDIPYLSDFGIAKLVQASTPITSSNVVIGTPAYMSPEQGRGDRDIDGRSDVYALGALLFQMLSGRVPYESETPTGQIVKHITDPIPDILALKPDLPPGIQTVIERAMAKNKQHRYNTAGEMVRALQRVVNGEAVTPAPKSYEGDVTLAGVEQPSSMPTGGAELIKPVSSIQEKHSSRPETPKFAPRKQKLPAWGWVFIAVAALMVVGIVLLGFLMLPKLFANVPLPTSTIAAQSFTDTPQPSDTPRPLLTETPTAETPVAQYLTYKAVARISAMPIRSGPGLFYLVIERYPKGVEFDVVGRSEDDHWLALRLPMSDNTGWARLEHLVFEGNIQDLPVISIVPQPSDTPAASSTPGALVDEDAARLRSGPGLNYDILVVLTRGTGLVVLGRSANAEWLQVYVPDEDKTGWMAVSTLIYDFALNDLPIVEAPPSPTPRPEIATATSRPKKTPTPYP